MLRQANAHVPVFNTYGNVKPMDPSIGVVGLSLWGITIWAMFVRGLEHQTTEPRHSNIPSIILIENKYNETYNCKIFRTNFYQYLILSTDTCIRQTLDQRRDTGVAGMLYEVCGRFKHDQIQLTPDIIEFPVGMPAFDN